MKRCFTRGMALLLLIDINAGENNFEPNFTSFLVKLGIEEKVV
jgi:hypothetical protein